MHTVQLQGMDSALVEANSIAVRESSFSTITTTDSTLNEQLFIARQPILDRQGELVAYELLYRRGNHTQAEVLDGNQATTQLLVATLFEFGLEELTNGKTAFINVTEDLIAGNHLTSLPADMVTLEVLETVSPDDRVVVQKIAELKSQGYTIALDDFVLSHDNRELIEVADIIKVDLRLLSEQQLVEQVKVIQEYPVKLLAEKVETREEYERCLELGFDYFQGYYFIKPQVMEKKRTPSSRLTTLKLLSAINDPGVSFAALAEIVQHDVTLSYRLLKYLKSPLAGYRGEITSIQHAIQLLGLRHLQQLANLLALSGIDDKPATLLATSLLRAKMCEEIVRHLNSGEPAEAFTVGLLSTLDAFFDMPMKTLMDSLPLSSGVRCALLHGEGAAGHALACVTAIERGEWSALEAPETNLAQLQQIYFSAILWANSAAEI